MKEEAPMLVPPENVALMGTCHAGWMQHGLTHSLTDAVPTHDPPALKVELPKRERKLGLSLKLSPAPSTKSATVAPAFATDVEEKAVVRACVRGRGAATRARGKEEAHRGAKEHHRRDPHAEGARLNAIAEVRACLHLGLG